MNKEKLAGVLRHVLTFGGGYAVAQGWISEENLPQVVGSLVTLAGLAWSFFAPEKKTK